VRCCSGAADPAVASWHVPGIDGFNVNRAAEPPALTLQGQPAGIALGLSTPRVLGGAPPRFGNLGQFDAASGLKLTKV
jgi:hypothetical protein